MEEKVVSEKYDNNNNMNSIANCKLISKILSVLWICQSIAGTIHLWRPRRIGVRGGIFKCITCLLILLFLNSSFIVHLILLFIVDKGWGHNWSFSVDIWLLLATCTKDQLYTRFIFNNYSSFLNSLQHLVRPYVVLVFTM